MRIVTFLDLLHLYVLPNLTIWALFLQILFVLLSFSFPYGYPIRRKLDIFMLVTYILRVHFFPLSWLNLFFFLCFRKNIPMDPCLGSLTFSLFISKCRKFTWSIFNSNTIFLVSEFLFGSFFNSYLLSSYSFEYIFCSLWSMVIIAALKFCLLILPSGSPLNQYQIMGFFSLKLVTFLWFFKHNVI